jgi:hypothetical protein
VTAFAQWRVIHAVKDDAFIAVKKLAFSAGKTTLIKQNRSGSAPEETHAGYTYDDCASCGR